MTGTDDDDSIICDHGNDIMKDGCVQCMDEADRHVDDPYYYLDPDDPEAPVKLDEYSGLEPGMKVIYVNNVNPRMTLPGPLVLTALYRLFPPTDSYGCVQAVLNDGEWEVNADNLVPEVE